MSRSGVAFSLDGSLFDVAMEIFPWANYNNQKAAFKLHLGLDHDGLIPAFASVTVGKGSEMEQARLFRFPKGSVVVFDKGYNDYTWHNTLTEKGIFFVTRIRGNAAYEVIKTHPVRKNSGIISDEVIRYTHRRTRKRHLKPVRKVVYQDAESENKKLHRNQHECSCDSNYGGALHLPYFEMDEIYVLSETKSDADHSTASVESVC